MKRRLRKVIRIDEMQLGFVPEKESTDAIVVLKQKQENVP